MLIHGGNLFGTGTRGLNSLVGGIPVIVSIGATEKVQARTHTRKRWMKDSYHRRIQKKWLKRFGYFDKPAAFQTPTGFIVHPEIAEALRRNLRKM